jgi:serine/threonine-protein kinase
VSEDDTVVEGRGAAAASSTIASSADALLRDERSRTQRLAWTGLSLAIATSVALPILGGDRTATIVLIASMIVLALANVFLLVLAREGKHFTEARLAVPWLAGIAAALGTTYYFGLLSGALGAAMLALYFIGLGASGRIALAAYGFFLASHGTLVVLAAAGVIRDRGLLSSDAMSPSVRLAAEALILGLFVAAFLLARASRRTTQAAVVELERAVRALAHREALLAEARADFARALRIGDAGRWTDQVLGSFKLGVVIGRGSMGEVYAATGTATAEDAAIKMLHLEAVTHQGNVERFRREARIAGSLSSPHVVRVLEVGDDSAALPYIAMERLRGVDLAQHLRARARLPLGEVVELVRQVANGLEAARAAGIVHRDLKPQNLFRVDGTAPTWKILDFGVSKVLGSEGTLTGDGIVGTPQYMAPEQASGDDVDHRADVYALAAIAYRCLTGRPLFTANDVPSLLYKLVHTLPVRAGALVPLPAAVDDVLGGALAKRPGDRPASAVAFADALAAAAP